MQYKTIEFRQEMILLAFIIMIGSLLRFYHIGYESIWLDEAFSIRVSSQNSISDVWKLTTDDVHPPLHNIILYFMHAFGNSEFIMRLPSAIFGILTIPLVYLTGVTFFGKTEGLIAAFLLAISPLHLSYSQEARAYTLMAMFSLASLYFFYKAVKDNNQIDWILFIVSSALAFYSHYYTLFVFLSEGMYFIIIKIVQLSKVGWAISNSDKNFITFIGSFIVLLISTLPLVVSFLSTIYKKTSHAPTWGMQQSINMIPSILIQFSALDSIIFYLFLLLFFAGFTAICLSKQDLSILITIFFIIPFTASYILSALMPFHPRYLLYMLPIYLLIISKGITGIAGYLFPIPKRNDNITKYAATVLIFITLFTALSYHPLNQYYSILHKEDWRGIAQYLGNNLHSGDTIVMLPNYMTQPLLYYYNNSKDNTELVGCSTEACIVDTISKYQNQNITFLVTWDILAADPSGKVLGWLNRNTYLVKNFNGVYMFLPKNWNDIASNSDIYTHPAVVFIPGNAWLL